MNELKDMRLVRIKRMFRTRYHIRIEGVSVHNVGVIVSYIIKRAGDLGFFTLFGNVS